ncbi:hypothetical protein HDV03_004131 [Kappamyces sp. JEL0829]|nr:hypothetical protein HDV03_004131 [Kappamyces sp. JEL0829]
MKPPSEQAERAARQAAPRPKSLVPLVAVGCSVAAMVAMSIPFFPKSGINISRQLPFMPTTREKTRVLSQLLAEALALQQTPLATTRHRQRKMVDFGSGDGRIVLACAATGLFTHCIGIESNRTLWALSHLKRLFSQPAGVSVAFLKQDFWTFSLADEAVDVVVVFGIPALMNDFKAKFERELRPRSIVITNKFPIPGWTPLLQQGEILLYQL